MDLGFPVKGTRTGRSQVVVVQETDLVKGRGIWPHDSVARDGRHGGRGTLLDMEDPILNTDIDRKPFTPEHDMRQWNRAHVTCMYMPHACVSCMQGPWGARGVHMCTHACTCTSPRAYFPYHQHSCGSSSPTLKT